MPQNNTDRTRRSPNLSLSNTTNHVLVALLGSIRGGELTWHSLQRNLLQPNGADLALMIGSTSQHTLLQKMATYVWTIRERSDWEWSTALDAIGTSLHVHNATAWRSDLGFYRVTRQMGKMMPSNITWMSPAFLGPSKWSAAINLVMRWELKHRIAKHGLLRKYRRFVITRSDQYYGCPLDLRQLDPRYLWVPEGEDFGGLCDRFIACSRHDVLHCLSIVDGYLQQPTAYPAWLNPERFYLRRLKVRPPSSARQRGPDGQLEAHAAPPFDDLQPPPDRPLRQALGLWSRVHRFPRLMFTAAAPGDPTRWSVASRRPDPIFGVHLK